MSARTHDKTLISADKAELASYAWSIYLDNHPNFLADCLKLSAPSTYAITTPDSSAVAIDPEALIQAGWFSGFYTCLHALEDGTIKALNRPAKPEAN